MKTYSNFDHGLTILLLLFIGLGPAIHYYLPLKLLGVSLFTTLIPFSLICFLYLKNLSLYPDSGFVIFMIVLLILIILARQVFYGEPFKKQLTGNVFAIYLPFLFSIFKKFEFTPKRSSYILRVIEIVLFVHVANSFCLLAGLPYINNVNENADDFVLDSRFNGILGGANVQANFTAILFIVYISVVKNIGVIRVTVIGLLTVVSILPTVSRGGMLMAIINMFNKYYLYLKKGGTKVKVSVIIISILLVGVVTSLLRSDEISVLYENYEARNEADDQSGGRLDRLSFAYNRITEDFFSFLFGISGIRQVESKELSISDNSALLVMANLGVIYFLLFGGYIIKQFNRKDIIQSDALIFMFTLILVTFVNNAFLYFQWVAFSISGYYMIIHYGRKENSDDVQG